MHLLERESYLAELEASLAEARVGLGSVVLVSGEAGIGKTTLVERFTREHRTNVKVLWGMCDPLFTPRPLGPLYDMAGQISGNLPDLLATDANRSLIFSTVLGELQRGTTMVVFEDVHWADEATFDLLRYIGRRIRQTSAMLVLTYRDDELDTGHPLRIVLGDLASLATARRISLPPLSESAVRVLVGDQQMNAGVLYRQSGGNPFFITEVLASEGVGIPATIKDVVLARTARLSPSGRAVLEAAAIIGLRIEPWLLAEVTGAEAHAADESVAVGMLLGQGDVLSFRHELARATILETISPHRKPVLHRLVLDALRSLPAPFQDLARLAHHAEASDHREGVLEFGPAAARQASAAGAHREAAALYALVLRFAGYLNPSEHALILEAYSRECNLTERPAEAIDALRKSLEIWHELNQPLKQGEALATLVIILRNTGSNSDAEQVSQAAIDLLEPLPPSRELALAYRAQATLRLANRDHTEAIDWGKKAIALAEGFQDTYVLAMAHVAVGSAWLFLDFERGCAYLDQRLEVERESEQMVHIANLYAYVGSCSAELYQFHRAADYLSEGINYVADRALDIFRRYMMAWLALSYIHLGRWVEADQLTNQLLQSPAGSAVRRIPTLVALGRLRARRGNPGVGKALLEALELATRADNLPHLGLVHAARAEAAWLAGDRPRTLAEANVAYDLAMSKRHPWFTGELAFWRWRCGEKVDLPEWTARPFAMQISGDWRGAADEWERLGCPYEQARALADGDLDAQIEALKIFEQLGAGPAVKSLRQTLQKAGASQIPRKLRASTRENPFGLTNRQAEVLTLLTEGLSNAEIAARLFISPKTADHHVSAILTRLNVHSRQEAAARARQHPQFQKK